MDNIQCENKLLHRLYQFVGLVIVGILAYIATLIHVDYKYFGVLAIFVFYLFRKNKILMNVGFIALVLVYDYFSILKPYSMIYNPIPDVIIDYFIKHAVCTSFPLFFIDLYNHEKGKDTKYFLYLFYPIHLIIIYILHLVFS